MVEGGQRINQRAITEGAFLRSLLPPEREAYFDRTLTLILILTLNLNLTVKPKPNWKAYFDRTAPEFRAMAEAPPPISVWGVGART